MATRQKGEAIAPMPALLGTTLGVGTYRPGGKISKLGGDTHQLEGDSIS